MENKINIGTGNFWYFNFTLLEILKYLEKFTGFNGVELFIKHGHIFSEEEINILKKYKYNTVHLSGYSKKDIEWINYCVKNIPNFQHFTLHPDATKFEDITDEIEKLLSFENMDTRKIAFQKPNEMIELFNNFPNSGFTFDINHAEENNIKAKEFEKVQFPNKIHFSVVNKGYYSEYPEINTPHSMACLEKGFNFNLKKYKDCIITLEGLFKPGRDDLIQKEINLANKLLNE